MVQSLRILLAIKPGSIFHVCKQVCVYDCLVTPHPQVAYGLHELLRNNAANIHNADDWSVIFTLLEVVGAGASPELQGQASGEDSGQVRARPGSSTVTVLAPREAARGRRGGRAGWTWAAGAVATVSSTPGRS